MAQSLKVLIQGVETLSQAMDDIEDSVGDANRSLGQIATTLKSAEINTDSLEESGEELADTNIQVAGTSKVAGSAIDSMGDSARTSAAQVGFLEAVMNKSSISAGALSINVGAFTVALRQLHTQIPLIVTALGTLASSLGAVGSAAVTAGGAVGGIFAGGFIGLIEEVEQSFANVTNTGQATEKVLRAIGQMFRTALEPLVNQENVSLFVSGLESVAEMTSQAAQAVEGVKSELLDLFDVIGSNANFDALLGALQNTLIIDKTNEKFDSTGEVLAEFLGFVAEKLPSAIDQMNNTFVNLAPSLQQIGRSFLDLTQRLIEFAEGAGPAFVDVISMILDTFTALFKEINALSDSVQGAALKMFLLTAVTLRLASAFDSFMSIGAKFIDLMNQTVLRAGGLRGKLAGIIATGQDFLADHAAGVGRFSSAIISNIPILSAYQEKIDSIGKNDDGELLETETRIKRLESAMKGTIPTFDEFSSKIRNAFVEREEVTGLSGLLPDKTVKKPKIEEPDGRILPESQTVSQSLVAGMQNGFDRVKDGFKSLRERGGKAVRAIGNGFKNVAVGGVRTLGSSLAFVHGGFVDMDSITSKLNAGLMQMKGGFIELSETILPSFAHNMLMSAGAAVQQRLALMANTVAQKKNAVMSAILGKNKAKQTGQLLINTAALAANTVAEYAAAAGAVALNIALGPLLPLLIGISVAAALVVGVIGNLGTATKSATSGFNSLKQTALAIGEALLGYLVPVFNVTVDFIEMLLSPIFAVVDGFKLIVSSILSAAGAGEEGASMMEMFGSVMDTLGGIVSAFGPVFDFIGDVIYTAFITPFKIIATLVGTGVSLFMTLINTLIRFGKTSGIFDTIKGFIEGTIDVAKDFQEVVINSVNSAIEALNRLPGVNIGKIGAAAEGGNAGGASQSLSALKTDEGTVKDNLEKDKEDASSEQAGTTKPDISFDKEINNTANIDAESDEKETRIKTLVERALSNANTMRRNAAGQGGG